MIDIKQYGLFKPMESDTVISNVFNLYFKRFWVLFIASFIAALLIQFAFFQLGFFELSKITDPEELIHKMFGMRNEILIASLVYFCIYGLLLGFLINYLLTREINADVHLADVFSETLKRDAIHIVFFIILSLIIIILGAMIGIFVFIVGVFISLFYLGTILVPGSTIIVAENKNAIEAIERTFKLVHKDFWSTIGAFVLFILIMILIAIILSAITAIPYLILFFDNWHESGSFWEIFNMQVYDIGMWSIVISSFVSAITYPLYAIFSVVIYFKLRFVEESKS